MIDTHQTETLAQKAEALVKSQMNGFRLPVLMCICVLIMLLATTVTSLLSQLRALSVAENDNT